MWEETCLIGSNLSYAFPEVSIYTSSRPSNINDFGRLPVLNHIALSTGIGSHSALSGKQKYLALVKSTGGHRSIKPKMSCNSDIGPLKRGKTVFRTKYRCRNRYLPQPIRHFNFHSIHNYQHTSYQRACREQQKERSVFGTSLESRHLEDDLSSSGQYSIRCDGRC